MKKSRFTDSQIVAILKEFKLGRTARLRWTTMSSASTRPAVQRCWTATSSTRRPKC